MMRKYGMMLLGLTVLSLPAQAMTANEQMEAMKGLFIKEFNQIDTDKDGQISKDEFTAYQMDNLRANILSASTSEPENKEVAVTESVEPDSQNAEVVSKPEQDIDMVGIPPALKAMAEFDIDMDDVNAIDDISIDGETTEKTATTDMAAVDDIDLSISEDDNLKSLLKEMEEETAPQAGQTEDLSSISGLSVPAVEENKDAQISMMMNTIKKTLPKKIDDITTWTDIEYKNSTISYIYKADIDTAKFTEAEKASLELNIKNEACMKAYEDMCPKVKPMFIDEGINVQIRYFDSNDTELSSCNFNKETCSN